MQSVQLSSLVVVSIHFLLLHYFIATLKQRWFFCAVRIRNEIYNIYNYNLILLIHIELNDAFKSQSFSTEFCLKQFQCDSNKIDFFHSIRCARLLTTFVLFINIKTKNGRVWRPVIFSHLFIFFFAVFFRCVCDNDGARTEYSAKKNNKKTSRQARKKKKKNKTKTKKKKKNLKYGSKQPCLFDCVRVWK